MVKFLQRCLSDRNLRFLIIANARRDYKFDYKHHLVDPVHLEDFASATFGSFENVGRRGT